MGKYEGGWLGRSNVDMAKFSFLRGESFQSLREKSEYLVTKVGHIDEKGIQEAAIVSR